MNDSDFSSHIVDAAKRVWGEPNAGLSKKDQLRFGSGGSKAVDLKAGTWYDHETSEGGGVLDLLLKIVPTKKEAIDWLKTNCGFQPQEKEQERVIKMEAPAAKKLVATYDYNDENGNLLYQVRRLEPKTFVQCQPDPLSRDGWTYNLKGVQRVIYRLPEILEAIGMEKTIYIVEGEKDVDTLVKRGYAATCNAGGAGNWEISLSQTLKGANVIVIPDNDDAGRKRIEQIGATIIGYAASYRVLELPSLPPKGDTTDWFEAGGATEDFDKLSHDAPLWVPEKPRGVLQGSWYDQILKRKTRQDWIVKGLLGRGDLSCVYGEPGCSKSFLALDLCLHMASGFNSWLGHKMQQGGVVYVAAEGGRGMESRVIAWDKRHKPDGNRPFYLVTSDVDLRSPEGHVTALISDIKQVSEHMEYPLKLVVIDTLSRAMAGGNENSPDDMGAFIKNCGKIQEETKAHVMIIHHKGKDDGRGPRGHSSLRGAVDTAISVEKTGGKDYRFFLVKQKDGDGDRASRYQLEQVEIGIDEDGVPETSCVVNPLDAVDAVPQSQNLRLTERARHGARILKTCIAQKGMVIDPENYPTQGVRAVHWRDWEAACYATNIYVASGDIDDDTIREERSKAFQSALVELRKNDLIQSERAYVWMTKKGILQYY
jgi:hypothetical protein